MKKLASLSLSVCLLSACTTHFVGNTSLRDTPRHLVEEKIILNETTKQQIREMFGEPNKIEVQQYTLSEMWFYESYDKHTNYVPVVLLPFTLPMSLLTGHNFMAPKVKKEEQRQLRVQFEDNRVKHYSTAVDNRPNWY